MPTIQTAKTSHLALRPAGKVNGERLTAGIFAEHLSRNVYNRLASSLGVVTGSWQVKSSQT